MFGTHCLLQVDWLSMHRVWHKSCLRKSKKYPFQEQFSGEGLLSDQDSDPESDQISDEEYIPDTESDEDDDTSVQDVPMDPSAAVAYELGDSNPSEEKPEAEAGRHIPETESDEDDGEDPDAGLDFMPQSKVKPEIQTHQRKSQKLKLDDTDKK
ncbi:unnamed protein product [Arctogadus glacialis]